MSGFADGTFVSVARDADSWAKHVGADGEVSRAKSNNRTGTLKLTLAQTSNSNAILSGLVAADELTGDGVVPILIKDGSGTSLYFAGEGWVKKPADAEFGNEIGNREWTIDLAVVEMATLGN
jgi:hypothetical protein